MPVFCGLIAITLTPIWGRPVSIDVKLTPPLVLRLMPPEYVPM